MRLLSLHALIAGLALSSGCIESQTRACSWGTVCPTDRYCEASINRCLYPAQQEVCRGVEDASPLHECTFTDAPQGAYACQGGLCLRSECGDGLLGPEELCDDGNTVGGDGCSADCRSAELCGNGYVDGPAGEACDDGNRASNDGCSSGCTDEGMYYELLTSSLPGRFGAAAAYDPALGKTIVFSGFTPEPEVLTDTWEFDGGAWQQVSQIAWAWGRIDASLTFMQERERLVLFAGWSGNASLSDLWEFDGLSWIDLEPAQSPPPRSAHAAAHLPGTGLVIFGGERADRQPLDDLWAYDGTQWTQVTQDATPADRRYAALAHDETSGRLVLFGGSRGLSTWEFLDDTWEHDGVGWTQIFPATSPSPRHGHRVAWDPVGERLVLFGGMNAGGALNDTWAYAGGQWSELHSTSLPAPRGQFLMTRDAVADSLIVQSGHAGNYATYQDAWALQGDQWLPSAAASPKARVAPGMAFDSGRGATVLFGGQTVYYSDAYYGDTWQFIDHVWRLVSTATAPSARGYTPLVYAPDWGASVLFGGCGGPDCTVVLGDTWRFDGVSWSEPSGGFGPPARARHTMTYDADAQEMVLFGGAGVAGYRADTWRFDGTTWQQEPASGAPSPRAMAQMVYDPQRQVVVLFGGASESNAFMGDTWELDDSGWHQVFPATAPMARVGHQMIYHAGRQRVQLFGGYSATQWLPDLWEYDGTTWSYVALPAGAPWRGDFGLVYDGQNREVLLFGGGVSDTEASSETWSYRYDSNWPDEICLGGLDEDYDHLVDCADPDCAGKPCDNGGRCEGGACL